MNSYLVALYFGFQGECIPYNMVLKASNGDLAERALCHMAKHWWPESDFIGNSGEWFWRFTHTSIEFGEIHLLDDVEVSVFEKFRFMDIWNITLNHGELVITDRNGY
ncbi:hypothetical protein AAGW04_18065 [Pectobacterium aroidearum]|uniref:hypothetical protein n=1 Tax=Pectobacterium aroidearum TaxID=1201031 RepID=UPI0031588649